MKKLIFILLLGAGGKAFAQPKLPGGPDYSKALKGAMINLHADKSPVDPGEVTSLTVTIDIPGAGGNVSTYDYRPANPAQAPWTVTDWKIVEGGGRLVPSAENGNAYAAVLTAPDKVPANKCVIVEVTMMPRSKDYPKTILRKAVYINADQNIFYFDCKALGINNEKYVVDYNGGAPASMAALQKQVAALTAQMPANQRGKVKGSVPDLPQNAQGLNMAALTGNARGVYMEKEHTTTLTISGDKIAAINGAKASGKRSYLINISFPGRSTGMFKLKSKKEISAAIVLPTTGPGGISCGCYDSPEDKAERDKHGEPGPTCRGGNIRITKYDVAKKIVEGDIYANFETIVNKHIVYGDISGKFSVVLAN